MFLNVLGDLVKGNVEETMLARLLDNPSAPVALTLNQTNYHTVKNKYIGHYLEANSTLSVGGDMNTSITDIRRG